MIIFIATVTQFHTFQGETQSPYTLMREAEKKMWTYFKIVKMQEFQTLEVLFWLACFQITKSCGT